MTERDRFMARLEQAQRHGLADMKFFVCQGSSLSAEDFFAALNNMDDAIHNGRCERSSEWMHDITPSRVDALVS